MYTNGLFSFIATSPNDAVTTDHYDLYVDMSPWVIYPRNGGGCTYGCPSPDSGDWYGVIFNASNTGTFGSTPANFNYLSQYYRVYFYNRDSVKPIGIMMERCYGSSDYTCAKLASVESLPSNFIGNASGFDTLHIERLSDGTINIYLNDTKVLSAWDNNYMSTHGFGKFGTFIWSENLNATQNPPIGYEMQIDFDNIKVYQH